MKLEKNELEEQGQNEWYIMLTAPHTGLSSRICAPGQTIICIGPIKLFLSYFLF